MITFLLYTIIAWIATAALAKILHISIQQDQWLDNLLGWQNRLYQWDVNGKTFLAKAGGLCELCFSHAVSFISYWVYAMFMNVVVGTWLTSSIDSILLSFFINVIWYLVYVAIATNLSLYFIVKLFQK